MKASPYSRVFIAHKRDRDQKIQSLQVHLEGVSEIAGRLAGKIGLDASGELIGLLHDLGKYSNQFYDYIGSATGEIDPDADNFVDAGALKGKVDHSTAGAQWIWNEFAQKGRFERYMGQILALCVASHHSGLIDCVGADKATNGVDLFSKRMVKSEELAHMREAVRNADAVIIEKAQRLTSAEGIGRMVAPLREAIGKITAQAKDRDSPVIHQQIGLLTRLLFSCLIDADRIDTADFEFPGRARQRLHGRYVGWDMLIDRLETHLIGMRASKPIDAIRQRVSNECMTAAERSQGIYALTVPTGGGKTLASLRFALHHARKHGLDRIIYVVPFTSIIDQNVEVVRNILEPQGIDCGRIVLEHHSDLTPEEQGWREKVLTENWDAPVIYTTMVQFLETLFGSGTRGARRMHQLANSMVVFDEVQTLPIRCVHIFNNAINFLAGHCGSTALLCTATQPLLDKVDQGKGAMHLHAEDLIADVSGLFAELKRVEVVDKRKPNGWFPKEIADFASAETEKTGSCLVITNTKGAAQELHLAAKASNDTKIYYLSTNLCSAHRKKIISEVKERLLKKLPTLCFSTQLIEAGVDIDFGTVIRFTAGLDSMAQAAGRCNRSGARAVGYVYIVNPRNEDQGLKYLPDIAVGKDAAERVLRDYAENPGAFPNGLVGPEAMEWYYRSYFFARAQEMNYPVSKNAIGHNDSLLNLLSTNRLAVSDSKPKPDLYLRQAFKTAAEAFKSIDTPSRGIIVPWGEEGQSLVERIFSAAFEAERLDLVRRAQQYSVNVFPNIFEKLMNVGALRRIGKDIDIFVLDKTFYSADYGVSVTQVNLMETYIV